MSSKISSFLVLVLLAGVAASVRSYLQGWESLEERRPAEAAAAAPALAEPEAPAPEVQPVVEQSPAPACEAAPAPAPAAAARAPAPDPGPCAAVPILPVTRIERPAAETSPSRAFQAERNLPLPLGPLGVQLPGPSVVLPDDPI